jgi:hypothetical protein
LKNSKQKVLADPKSEQKIVLKFFSKAKSLEQTEEINRINYETKKVTGKWVQTRREMES